MLCALARVPAFLLFPAKENALHGKSCVLRTPILALALASEVELWHRVSSHFVLLACCLLSAVCARLSPTSKHLFEAREVHLLTAVVATRLPAWLVRATAFERGVLRQLIPDRSLQDAKLLYNNSRPTAPLVTGVHPGLAGTVTPWETRRTDQGFSGAACVRMTFHTPCSQMLSYLVDADALHQVQLDAKGHIHDSRLPDSRCEPSDDKPCVEKLIGLDVAATYQLAVHNGIRRHTCPFNLSVQAFDDQSPGLAFPHLPLRLDVLRSCSAASDLLTANFVCT